MTRHMTVPDDTASLEPSPPDAITRDREILKVGAPSSTWRLLVVDDADNDYLVVRELLAQGLPGAAINRAIAVSDACLTAAAADCVLLDVGVPDADGTVGVKRLTEEAPDTAIVVLTAAANEDLGVASLSAGAQDYLVKSRLDEQLLARSVRYAIERHRAAQLSRELIRADRQRAENARLERALTPTPIIRSSDITVVVRYQAGRRGSRLGGGFYDAVDGDDCRCAVLVGDVAGRDAARRAARSVPGPTGPWSASCPSPTGPPWRSASVPGPSCCSTPTGSSKVGPRVTAENDWVWTCWWSCSTTSGPAVWRRPGYWMPCSTRCSAATACR